MDRPAGLSPPSTCPASSTVLAGAVDRRRGRTPAARRHAVGLSAVRSHRASRRPRRRSNHGDVGRTLHADRSAPSPPGGERNVGSSASRSGPYRFVAQTNAGDVIVDRSTAGLPPDIEHFVEPPEQFASRSSSSFPGIDLQPRRRAGVRRQWAAPLSHAVIGHLAGVARRGVVPADPSFGSTAAATPVASSAHVRRRAGFGG